VPNGELVPFCSNSAPVRSLDNILFLSEDDEWHFVVDLKTAARLTGRTVATIKHLIRKRELPSRCAGGRVVVSLPYLLNISEDVMPEDFEIPTICQRHVEAVLLHDGWHAVDENSFSFIPSTHAEWREQGQMILCRPYAVEAVRLRQERRA
jgi:hypothetical protein